LILTVYEDDLEHPQWAPPGGYGIEPRWVVHRKTYEHTGGHAPTYLLYVDHHHSDVVLAVRGMNMAKESDYAVLLDNSLGQRRFDGGYVHNGLLKAAEWLFDAECDVLRDLLERNPGYTLTFAGHSLGSGVVAMLALVAVHNRDRLGGVERKRVRCFAMAPARCMSLNLAVRYADVINSVILQVRLIPSFFLDNGIESQPLLNELQPIITSIHRNKNAWQKSHKNIGLKGQEHTQY
jgi:hypothetical protein